MIKSSHPYMNIDRSGEKRVSESEPPPAKKPAVATPVQPCLWKPNPVQIPNFRHKLSLLGVGPIQIEKNILSNRFWNTIVSCTKSKKVFAFGTKTSGKNGMTP